jgi:signal transduction histidine kinase/CheY-like chemotaxis protein
VGRGTAFTITLPFGQAHLPPAQVRLDAPSPLPVQGSAAEFLQEALGWLPGQSRQNAERDGYLADQLDRSAEAENRPVILLAEDNGDMRDYVSGLLGNSFQVLSAANGTIALELAMRRRPDLVLTDVMMPEMDGFALLAALRRHPATRTVPVIMLSARAGEEAKIEGIEATADDYLTKPFTARELLARIEAHLKMAKLRKEALEQEEALTREVRKAQQFASEALDHIPDAVLIYDRDFRITFMNPAAEQTVRRLGRSHLGEKLWDLYPSVVGSAFEQNLRRAMEQRIPVEFEYYYQPWERWYLNRVFPQPGEGLIAYVRDTTEARKTEQALRRSEQLAAAGRLAVSISLEITREKKAEIALIENERMAMIGRLASSISHEINNPLEALTNVLYLAKLDPGLTGKARDLLEIADKELQRLSHIAARSLKFYRQRTAPASTSLEEILESVLFFHETRIKSRSIQLERRYRPAPAVFCYAGEIQQVFTNLIGNALDAMPDKARLLVAVRESKSAHGGEGVRVTIADSGAGMDEYTAQYLFHPFFTTKGEAGTGLGLWVTKGILDKHNSSIKVRSKLGCGTVFQLFFPLDVKPHTSTEPPAPEPPAA